MGLCKTSNLSIFTLINASDLKFCPHSYSSCVYLMMRSKGSNGKNCKMMMSHFGTLLYMYNGISKLINSLRVGLIACM